MTEVASPAPAAVLASLAWLRGERTVSNSDAIWAVVPTPRGSGPSIGKYRTRPGPNPIERGTRIRNFLPILVIRA